MTETTQPIVLEPNRWYLDTTRLEKAGFAQHSILGQSTPPEEIKSFYAFIEQLRTAGTPFELVTIDPSREACALYVKKAE